MANSLDVFLKEYSLNGDGTGYFDAYEKTGKWLDNESVRIGVVTRVATEKTFLLLQKLIDQQDYYDKLWKEFVSSNLLEDLKSEWNNEELTTMEVLKELIAVDIAFGFYNHPTSFFVYFVPETADAEHGIVLLCDENGNPLKTYIE